MAVRHWFKVALAGGMLFGVLGIAAMKHFTPHLPQLMAEGFPAPIWPAKGEFTAIEGGQTHIGQPSKPVPEAALTRFNQSGGRALLVIDGEGPNSGLVMETYADGMTRDTKLNSYSLVKTLIATLVLKAISEGRIDGLDTPLPDILGSGAPKVSLRQTLNMATGLTLPGEPPKDDVSKPLDDANFTLFSAVGKLHIEGIEKLMPQLQFDPSETGRFRYQSANTALLGLVVEAAFGQPLQTTLSQQIWQPSGAQVAQWRLNPTSGRPSAYCCLYARPLDWALVGRFLLNNGSDDAPFLDQTLWQDWILPDLPLQERRQGTYGMHIRHDILDREGAAISGPFAYMMGHGGQVVYLLPEHNRVVVRFGDGPQLLHSTLYELALPH